MAGEYYDRADRRRPTAARLAVRGLALALVCTAVGAAIGAALDPPAEKPRIRPLVTSIPLYRDDLEKADVFQARPPLPKKSGFFFITPRRIGETDFLAAGGTEGALRQSVNVAVQYARSLTTLQTRRARELLRAPEGEPKEKLRAAKRLIEAGPLYAIEYRVETPQGAEDGPFRTALLGLAVAALFLAGALPAVRLGGVLAWYRRPAWVDLRRSPAMAATLAVLLTALLAVIVGVGPSISLGAFLGGLMFMGAVAYAVGGTSRELRVLLAVVIVLSPMRGALEGLLALIEVPNGFLLVNSVQPALIGAGALAVLCWKPEQRRAMPPGLVLAWVAFAVVAALDILTQTVGLTVYTIGLVQYLLYPTFALLLWQALEPGDSRRFTVLLLLSLLAVTVSIGLDAAHITEFPEAAPGRRLMKPRYGGSTGSFIHAGILLGVAIPLAVGWTLGRRPRPNLALGVGILTVLLAGLILTFGRGGFAIAIVSLLLIFIGSGWEVRRRLIALALIASAIAIPVSYAAGRPPDVLIDRATTFVKPNQDVVNTSHWRVMKHALESYWDAPAPQKVFGRGLAATGNAARVAGGVPDVTDNYLLKVLIETGIVGLLAIGAVLLWALAVFLRTVFSSDDTLLCAVGAAGIALTGDFLLLPVLEIQVLAMVWWLLLVIALRSRQAATP